MRSEIPLFKVFMSPNASEEVAKVLNSGYIGQGPKVEEFEDALEKWFSSDNVLTVNSATSGLTLALRLWEDEIRAEGYDGDIEVLSTPLTCTATNWPILANKMGIKWVDIDQYSLNLDLDDLERKLSPSTRIIMVVHWGGYPVNLDRVKSILDKCESLYGFRPRVIQDCAHSFGSKIDHDHVGAYGPLLKDSIAVYSFQAIKHLTSVDGGAMIVPSRLKHRTKLLRWYGIDREGDRKDFRCEADVEAYGYKFHMNDVCATVGLENLKVIKPIVQKFIDNGVAYNKGLGDLLAGVTLLNRNPRYTSANWIYSLKVEQQQDFMRAMTDRGISVSRVHERNDKHTCVAEYISGLPSLDKVINEMICIPSGWWVTEEDRQHIIDSIKKGW